MYCSLKFSLKAILSSTWKVRKLQLRKPLGKMETCFAKLDTIFSWPFCAFSFHSIFSGKYVASLIYRMSQHRIGATYLYSQPPHYSVASQKAHSSTYKTIWQSPASLPAVRLRFLPSFGWICIDRRATVVPYSHPIVDYSSSRKLHPRIRMRIAVLFHRDSLQWNATRQERFHIYTIETIATLIGSLQNMFPQAHYKYCCIIEHIAIQAYYVHQQFLQRNKSGLYRPGINLSPY